MNNTEKMIVRYLMDTRILGDLNKEKMGVLERSLCLKGVHELSLSQALGVGASLAKVINARILLYAQAGVAKNEQAAYACRDVLSHLQSEASNFERGSTEASFSSSNVSNQRLHNPNRPGEFKKAPGPKAK